MQIIEFEGEGYLIDEKSSVSPDDGFALEIYPEWLRKGGSIRLVTPKENKSCQSINQSDFWSKIIGCTKELHGVELMTLKQMTAKL